MLGHARSARHRHFEIAAGRGLHRVRSRDPIDEAAGSVGIPSTYVTRHYDGPLNRLAASGKR
jgi:hypothetical protein